MRIGVGQGKLKKETYTYFCISNGHTLTFILSFALDIFTYLKEPLQDEYMNDTRRGMTCDCVDGCESLLYLVELNVIRLPKYV